MKAMTLERMAGVAPVLAFVSIACAHTTPQQAEPKATTPQAVATPVSAATPTPAPVATSVPAAASPAPGSGPDAAAASASATAATAAADFGRDVRPILEQHCRPCHFEGGKMYERLPFDRPETIHTLGTRLFTRIKAEDEQAVIRRFLAGS